MKHLLRRKSVFSLIIAFAMCVFFIGITVTSAEAATSGKTGSSTIYVTTKPWKVSLPTEESVTLQQSQMALQYPSGFFKLTTKAKYGYWGAYTIQVIDANTGKTTKKYHWNGGQKFTVKGMDAGKSYKIVVSYNKSQTTINYNMAAWPNIPYSCTSSSWKVVSTNKVASYH